MFETSICVWDDGNKNIIIDKENKYYIIDFGQTFECKRTDDRRFDQYFAYVCYFIFEYCGVSKRVCQFVKKFIGKDIHSGYFDKMKINYSSKEMPVHCEKY